MQHNLEGIPFTETVHENGSRYSDFRSQLTPRYGVVWFDIVKGYIFLAAAAALFIFLDHRFHSYGWAFVIPFALLMGYIAAYLALFIHEAGHFNLHPDKKINDRLATIFLCLPYGLSMKSYRKIHWQHHLHLGTPQDTEISYFNAINKLFILETLTGIHLLRTVLKKEKNELLTQDQVQQSRIMLVAGFLLHAAILTAAILTNNWAFAITWILSFGIFFPFFATIRQILEHRDELAHHRTDFTKQAHGKISRLFVHSILSSSFGSAGFTRHMIHHWDPLISYTRMRDIEEYLTKCNNIAPIIESSRTTYTKTMKKLLKAP